MAAGAATMVAEAAMPPLPTEATAMARESAMAWAAVLAQLAQEAQAPQGPS